MKTWMKVVLGVFAGIAALVSLIFWLTGDITKTGDDFFAAVQNDDMDTAYALLSDDFQVGTSKAELKSYLAANALDNIKETSWSSRFITGGTGRLEGTVTTAGGSKIPLQLRLIDSEAGWRINAIEKESAGLKEASSSGALPSPDKQKQLFKDTVTVFAQSLSEKSMKKLWDTGTADYQRTVSLENLDKGFGKFFKYAEGYLELSQQEPIIDGSEINEETRVLAIRGHYPVEPFPIYFRQLFFYEGVDWKFDGIALKVGLPPE
ncbi:hypothetical protein [Parasphingorhabdus cellanae]|uniref:DUF4878 domain-containing protein n=1 Tax=Parasphingorhabdus cellanae TaxID=2806553 RepID=A0ABX7T0I8_9SPHN|nr:hypothetical protein [Parasphingorhabdus cellanae]QTD55051.1 hypothetical protein J4G78_12545 [Parasphingorhabdus cellanae]